MVKDTLRRYFNDISDSRGAVNGSPSVEDRDTQQMPTANVIYNISGGFSSGIDDATLSNVVVDLHQHNSLLQLLSHDMNRELRQPEERQTATSTATTLLAIIIEEALLLASDI